MNIKDYETYIFSNKNVMNIGDKDKKYNDKRKLLKEQIEIGNNASFIKINTKGKEVKVKDGKMRKTKNKRRNVE